ncbi:isopentenyl-diphosphate Delta-isomerase [Frigidibacter sp. RF13]|uniref:isopentenyl-diphosphate Delta-isomerase n=1 Tax=Frigidibacter sp. RF13 TaxID=2997340 RepID=UPI00227203FB|nr:isopentenyl-diphosphate Delta-isomerase [Frigidibacter sp. RF13]MCY1126415.1 isopentenyl-diphosphate Delta-isomerase [Frigidibacter sp. RF13]
MPGAPIAAWEGGILAPHDKIDVHRRGLRHPAVSVFLTVGEEVLLQRRALGKYHTPGLWANSCCTHPHWRETPEACARRRVREELGVEVGALHPRGTVEYRADVGGGMVEHEVVEVFRAPLDHKPRLAPDPAEVMECRWEPIEGLSVLIDAAPETFTPWLKIYLRDHFSEIFGN